MNRNYKDMYKKKEKAEITQRVAMFLLAVYPILNSYLGPIAITYAEYAMLLFSGLALVRRNNVIKFPKYFIVYWGLCAFQTIANASEIKLTTFIPGGLSFCLWVLALVIFSAYFNLKLLQKYMRIIATVSIIVFVGQEFMYMLTGVRFCALLPLSESLNYGDVTYSQLAIIHMNIDRSPSLFLEPSYFGQFLMVLLTLELFIKQHRDKFVTPFALIIILTLLFLRSGTGLIVMVLIFSIKAVYYYRKSGSSKIVLGLLIVLPLAVYGINAYIDSSYGKQMAKRQTELTTEDDSGYVRVVNGYNIYGVQSTFGKIFGVEKEEALKVAKSNHIRVYEGQFNYNGFQTVLIEKGIIGLLLILLIYGHLYRGKDLLPKMSVITLLALSLIEAVYLSPLMLILTVVAFKAPLRFEEYENSYN